MYSVYYDYKNSDKDNLIAIVPVKGMNISKKYTVDDINIYPNGTIDIDEIIKGMKIDMTFWKVEEDFFDSTIIAFPIKYKRKNFMGTLMPMEKDKLIKKVLGMAEDVMNVFRYINSNFDKQSNLPQRAGYIKDIICGFIIYYPYFKTFDYIWDKYYVSNISIGQQLNIDVDNMKSNLDKYFSILKKDVGEVGSIIKHAFSLYSNILYMSTATNKFMQSMSLLEYLANPFEYEKMQKAKTKIIPFSVNNKKRYNEICERFKELTSLKNEENKEIGYRTLIIHNGRSIEDILDESYKIDFLLRELQTYICNVINTFILHYKRDWSYINDITKQKYNAIQNVKNGYEGKYECDTVVILDFDFLNKAIQEVYQLYPNIDKKFHIEDFLYCLIEQVDIKRRGYQIPINIIYT